MLIQTNMQRVKLNILLSKSTKKYPMIKFWMTFEQNWYKQLILYVSSNIRRFKVVQVIPTIITFHPTCLFHFQKYSHQHVYSIQHDYWIRFHVPSNMFIQSNMSIWNTRVVLQVQRITMTIRNSMRKSLNGQTILKNLVQILKVNWKTKKVKLPPILRMMFI